MANSSYLSVWDYVIFAAMLVVSAAIGIYSALSGDRQRTTDEYLLGNRKMHVVPVALSMMVSFVSAISVLGTPTEMYVYNSMFWWNIVGYAIGAILACQMFVPVFFRLQVTSIYEYMELRFSRSLRIANMIIFCIQMNFYMGIVIYTPALALNAATGMSLTASILSTGAVCIFYTSIGGMKAVLWTDTFQTVVMTLGIMAVIIAATIEIGGLGEVWTRAQEGGRLVWFDMRGDMTLRNTFWTVNIGMTIVTVSQFGMNQATAQRCISCGTLEKAKLAIFLAVIAEAIVISLICFSGVVMFAYYHDCDPFTAGKVQSPDQLMPYLVMEVFHNKPGIPGIFLSSVLSASLSTLSSGLNALAAVTGEDLIKIIWPNMEGRKYTAITKLLSFLYGILAIGIAFLASVMGEGVLKMGLSIYGITYGGVVGVYILGVYVPRCNAKGAMIGLVVSIGVMLWLKVGAFLTPYSRDESLPMSVAGCPAEENATYVSYTIITAQSDYSYTSILENEASTHTPEQSEMTPLEKFYALSYLMYGALGVVITLVAGVIGSAITGFNDPSAIDKRLTMTFGDVLCCCLPVKWNKKLRFGVQDPDDEEDDDDTNDISGIRNTYAMYPREKYSPIYDCEQFVPSKEYPTKPKTVLLHKCTTV